MIAPEPFLSLPDAAPASALLSRLQTLQAERNTPLLQTVSTALGECLFASRADSADSPALPPAIESPRPDMAFFVVQTGRVRVLLQHEAGETTLARLAQGDFFYAPGYASAGGGRLLARASHEGEVLRVAGGLESELQDVLQPYLAETEARVQRILSLATSTQSPASPAPNNHAAAPELLRPATLYSESPDFPPAVGAEKGTRGQGDKETRRRKDSHAEPTTSHQPPATNGKFPALLQVSETDCGAACLAMALRVYGKHVGVNRLRLLANVSRDGASLKSLAQAAETLGFQTRAVKTGYEQLAKLSAADLPAIVHWQGFHFIVLYQVKADSVVVADPAIGLRRLSKQEFMEGWTGYALFLTPTARLEAVAESMPTFRQYLPLLKPFRRVLIDILVASLLLQLFGLATPIFTQVVLDKALVHQNESMLNVLLIGMLLLTVLQALTVALRQYLLVHTARRLHLQMVVAFYQHMLKLPLRFFEDRRVGDMLKRFNENARIREILTGRAIGVVVDCMMIVVYFALMLVYNVKLSLLAGAFVPAYLGLLLTASPILRRQQREAFEKTAEAEALMVETVQGIGTVKATASEAPLRWKWQNLMTRSLNVQFRNALSNMNLYAGASVLQTLNTVLLMWYGARLVMAGEMSVGELVAFNALALAITRPIISLIDLWNDFQEFGVALERLNDVFDAEPEEDDARPGLSHLPPVKGKITFENLTFRYPTRPDHNVLQNIRLEIQPGQTVALVGRSGAGKTTFASLLLRLYEPTAGRIRIDGVDIKNVTLSSLRDQIGVVMQDNFLFSGTIRDNIACGDLGADFDTVVGAAMLAGAHDFIQELPLGYETRIGEHGQGLSGGQRQRVAIARALYKDPRILILDEATSALDTESERAIQRNLDGILRNRTTLVIAHRLSTIRSADLIVVLDQGCIVEQGTHAQLMQQQGLYFYLNSQQLND